MPWLFRRPGWIVATGLLLTVVLGACTAWIKYDHNLLHLQPRGLDSVKTELTLINHTAGASFHAISYTDTAEEALALKARYEKLPEVGRVVEVASLVPPDQDVKIALLADIQRRLRRLPPRGVPISHAKPKMSEIASQLVKLTGHLRPLTAGGNQPVLEEVRNSLTVLQYRLYNAADGTEMIQHLLQGTFDERLVEERLQAFDQRLAGYLAEDLHQLRDVSTPAPITVADLPPALRERYIGKNGKWLLQIFPAGKDSLWEFDPLKRFIGRIQTVDPNATGKPFTTVEGLSAMKNGLEWAGLYAFVAIVLVLVVDFRDVRVTLLALAPLVMGVLLSLGIMGLCGVPLNPANMIAFPLILGVGVDNGVHVLHDYLLRRRENKSTISHAIGRGVLIKALTTIIGFGTLMVSRQRGLVGLGFILTLGVTCCMLTALVFLPAVLRLWAGKKETAVSIEIEAESRRLAA